MNANGENRGAAAPKSRPVPKQVRVVLAAAQQIGAEKREPGFVLVEGRLAAELTVPMVDKTLRRGNAQCVLAID